MNREAIFSDGTLEYRNPWEPKENDRVKLRVRVAHGKSAQVVLCTPNYKLPMDLDEAGDVFDYYRVMIQVGSDPFQYVFQIHQGDETVYYDRYGVCDDIRWEYAFYIAPGFDTPDWVKGAVMYQILVDRFNNGDPTNDVESGEYYYISMPSTKVDKWETNPDSFDVCKFYGGDLEGVRQKLYYLKSLGVEVIYFNPLFVSPSNHKYDIQDYDYIDPHYGRIVNDGGALLEEGETDNTKAERYIRRVADKTNLDASNEFFARFVSEAHEKGIRVILDGVFNHCGSFNKWMDKERIYENRPEYPKGAYISEDSPYNKYFSFYEDGKWPYNAKYDGWWGHDTLPKLNYEKSEELCNYILHIGKKWVSAPYYCDGWRLDVAADLGHSEEFNHKFWHRFRDAVKEANPNAVILAEHYGDASAWLRGDQWDTIMNYDAFMEPVSYFLTGMEKHSDGYDEGAIGDGARFEASMRHYMSKFLTPSLYSSMNQLSNHDHSRFLTRTNHKVGRVGDLGSAAASEGVNIGILKAAVLIQMTWPGAPTLYYGDEAGLCGFTDPDNRRTYPWGTADYELIDFHRDMINEHKMAPALKKGAFIFLRCDRDFISYGRFNKEQKCVVLVNGSNHDIEVDIPVWKAEVPKECEMTLAMVTTDEGYSIMPVRVPVHEGNMHVRLMAHQAALFEKNL
ncbi:MAG: glycoside hydrolase family 13 protein [Lachnospiraceae bacterium]|nr:glycoside hydrolase family 13 protein [Lachnospiraceae bacterium]